MHSAAIAITREIGVDTGGSNVQFGVDPKTGRMVVIERNPRVSRSSAVASKATGCPIAEIVAKLAVGESLDELENDITRDTPASVERLRRHEDPHVQLREGPGRLEGARHDDALGRQGDGHLMSDLPHALRHPLGLRRGATSELCADAGPPTRVRPR